jgi:LSD1 subclass zinc finger protein
MTMHICETCRNMLHYSRDKEGNPAHKCLFCDKLVPISADALLFEKTSAATQQGVGAANPFIEYDLTLPCMTNIPCQDRRCTAAKGVVYERVDEDALVNRYTCLTCKAQWLGGSGAPP